MSEILGEQLSAFLDGELPAEEIDLLLTRLDRDPELRSRYARYTMVGECLSSGSACSEALVVAERVRAALEQEAGGHSTPALSPRATSPGLLAFGAAAALAVVALFVVGPRTWQSRQVPVMARSEASAFTARGGTADQIVMISPGLGHRADPRTAARLTGYLAAHVSYASPLSRSTMGSHLVSAHLEHATWSQMQDSADVR